MLLAPLARTPMDKKMARSMDRYQKSVRKALDMMTPWKGSTRLSGLRQRYADQMPEDEQILVIPDGQISADSPLFKDAPVGTDKPKRRG